MASALHISNSDSLLQYVVRVQPIRGWLVYFVLVVGSGYHHRLATFPKTNAIALLTFPEKCFVQIDQIAQPSLNSSQSTPIPLRSPHVAIKKILNSPFWPLELRTLINLSEVP